MLSPARIKTHTLVSFITAMMLLTFSALSFADKVNTNWRGLAIKGYDAVAYFDVGATVEGDSDYSYEWQDAIWRFSSQTNLDKFIQSPKSYAPQYGGYCAYAVSKGYTADTDPEAWTIVNGKLYLNYSKSVRKIWSQDRAANITKADANWPEILAGL